MSGLVSPPQQQLVVGQLTQAQAQLIQQLALWRSHNTTQGQQQGHELMWYESYRKLIWQFTTNQCIVLFGPNKK